jgi:hypothetical protein
MSRIPFRGRSAPPSSFSAFPRFIRGTKSVKASAHFFSSSTVLSYGQGNKNTPLSAASAAARMCRRRPVTDLLDSSADKIDNNPDIVATMALPVSRTACEQLCDPR